VYLNLELREIVIGRIAAMAFDFSFHYRTSPNGKSAFADRIVMDMYCSILSANAVASGPLAVRTFATEWIIPSSINLPPFSVASVVLHLALEAQRKSAPAGTKDTSFSCRYCWTQLLAMKAAETTARDYPKRSAHKLPQCVSEPCGRGAMQPT
jgi:hypothetical protein